MQSIEDIVKILSDNCLNPIRYSDHGEIFERYIKFEIGNVSYFIEWWSNLANLTIGEEYSNYIPFTLMQPDNCWPSYRRGLKFFHNTAAVAMIAINKLDWQKESKNTNVKP